MSTIEQNLQRLVNAKNAISEAIIAKGGTVSDGDGLEDFPTDIATITSGDNNDEDANMPIRFIDYDGSIVASYTPEEFAGLTSLPANPSHDGLTAQGWNWSLTDAKAYVAKYGFIDIGQMYVTNDGRTRLYVKMQESSLSPTLNLYLNKNSELDIDWGDGSTHNTLSSTSASNKSIQHNYAISGNYVISIGVNSGSFKTASSTAKSILLTADTETIDYLNTIQKIELGSGITELDTGAFRHCYSLKQISLPNFITSINSGAFGHCYSLKQINLPNSITRIDVIFSYCRSINQITIPNSITSIAGSAFSYCPSLNRIALPDSITTIPLSAFKNCSTLKQIILPDSLSSIGNETFFGCIFLEQINLPSTITSIGVGAFANCSSLIQITLPSNLAKISNKIFYECISLERIVLPDKITEIGTEAFYHCYHLAYIKFPNKSPVPAGTNAFYSIASNCKLYVPSGWLSSYKSATNYPGTSSSSYSYYTY